MQRLFPRIRKRTSNAVLSLQTRAVQLTTTGTSRAIRATTPHHVPLTSLPILQHVIIVEVVSHKCDTKNSNNEYGAIRNMSKFGRPSIPSHVARDVVHDSSTAIVHDFWTCSSKVSVISATTQNGARFTSNFGVGDNPRPSSNGIRRDSQLIKRQAQRWQPQTSSNPTSHLLIHRGSPRTNNNDPVLCRQLQPSPSPCWVGDGSSQQPAGFRSHLSFLQARPKERAPHELRLQGAAQAPQCRARHGPLQDLNQQASAWHREAFRGQEGEQL
eukprot:368666-Rhodomonas_salina.2